MSSSLAGFDVTVVQSQGDQLLKASIDLLMHGRILGSDVAEFLKQPRTAVVVVPLGILEPLVVVVGGLLGSLQGIRLRVGGSRSLHCLRTGGTVDPPLASSCLLLLGSLNTRRGVLRRTGSLRRRIVVNTTHMVEEVPSTRESISRDGSITSLKQAKVGVIAMAVESMSLAFVAEQAGIGRELQLGLHTGRNLATVWLQVGIQILVVSAFLGSRGMVARFLSIGEWAVILSITVGRVGIVWVVAGVPQLRVLLGSLSRGFPHGEGWKEFFLLDLGLGRWGRCLQSGSASILGRPNGPVRVLLTERWGEREQRISQVNSVA